MKNTVLTLTASLFVISASAAASAQIEKIKSNGSESVAIYNLDAPKILNDRICAKMCDASQFSCDPAGSKKPDGRCS